MTSIRIACVTLLGTVWRNPTFCCFVTLYSMGLAHAEDPQLTNPWIRHAGPANARGVIVFIHGVTGNAKSSWSSNESFWPELITRDSSFDGHDVYSYKYPSPL